MFVAQLVSLAIEMNEDVIAFGGDHDFVMHAIQRQPGAAIGQFMRRWLPLRSALARGALFGMGAHGAGTAKARELAADEGAVAGLVMVMAGLFNVLVTPAVVVALQA